MEGERGHAATRSHRSRALRAWLGALLRLEAPGAGLHVPRVRITAVLIIFALLALQVVARYEWGFLDGAQWQAVHIALGLVTALAVIRLFHGPGFLSRVRGETWFVIFGGAAFFCLFWYFGRTDSYREYLAPHVDQSAVFAPIYGFIYFSLGALLFRFFVPFASQRLLFGRRPGELGARASSNPTAPTVKRVGWVYLVLFLGVLPFVVMVAQTKGFQAKYPLCRTMISPEGGIALEHFLIYEGFYLLIFVSGELFWRGYLTFGTERDLGLYGVVLMVVPYVTGHFGKPLPETLGAIAAGSVLGFLALKHRSVWLGVVLHYGIALSMDLLAVQATGIVIYSE